EQRRRHGPAVEIDAGRTGSGRVERRIDIVGPRFRGAYGETAPLQCCKNTQRHDGLAGTRARCRDDEAARHHRLTSLGTAASHPKRRVRTATLSPMAMIAGGSNPAWRTFAATSRSVETTMRSSAVVAEAITAAGVDGA